jgi:hypothetical protein
VWRGLGQPQGIKRHQVPRQAPKALDPRAKLRYLRAVEACPSARDRAIALLPLFAGTRIAEIAALDVADVRLSARKGEVHLVGKGREVQVRARASQAARGPGRVARRAAVAPGRGVGGAVHLRALHQDDHRTQVLPEAWCVDSSLTHRVGQGGAVTCGQPDTGPMPPRSAASPRFAPLSCLFCRRERCRACQWPRAFGEATVCRRLPTGQKSSAATAKQPGLRLGSIRAHELVAAESRRVGPLGTLPGVWAPDVKRADPQIGTVTGRPEPDCRAVQNDSSLRARFRRSVTLSYCLTLVMPHARPERSYGRKSLVRAGARSQLLTLVSLLR